MAVGLSTVALANAMLNGVRNTSFAIAATYIQIHTADPGANGTNAVSVGSTARPAVTFAAAASGALALTGTPPVWTNGGTNETITHISVHSSATPGAGTFYWSSTVTSKTWAAADTLTLSACGLGLSPLAA